MIKDTDKLIQQIEALEDEMNSPYALYENGYKSGLYDAVEVVKKLTIPIVSNCKPTGYEKNNLPIEIRHAYCEAVEIYQHILSYEYGIISKDEFIKEVEATKRKH